MAQDRLQKLELTWIGKDEQQQPLEPRILIEDVEFSYGDCDSVIAGSDPQSHQGSNMLIHGDNLLALKALEQNYAGRVKCIYIDPPYNTGNAFEHYDDGIEHSIWLNLISQRLCILRKLLSEDGAIFVQIDDNEAPYLKVMMDEIFGRSNYEATFYIKVRHEDRILREDIKYQLVMEQVLCYRKSPKYVALRRIKTKISDEDYRYDVEILGNPISIENINGYEVEIFNSNDWRIIPKSQGEGQLKQYQIRGSLITQSGSASEYYEKNLRVRRETDGLGTLYKVRDMGLRGDGLGYRYIMQPEKSDSKNGFYFQGRPLSEKKNVGLPYPNYYDFVDKFNRVGYEGGVEFKNGKKPEEYVKFFLELANTKKGDLVLDSFLGSGTTAAVAHKMGRRWIGVELGEHSKTHCVPRLRQVISGKDQGGISKAQNWKGGGGFRFYNLAPSLLNTDRFGNLVINKEYNADMLAAAMAKQEGFSYSPDSAIYWKQGRSSEADFIYTTTQFLTVEMLNSIKAEMAEGETLMICAKTFESGCKGKFAGITIKKIPQTLLGRCEFNRDDYSLNIINMPILDTEEDMDFEEQMKNGEEISKFRDLNNSKSLFD